MSLEPPSHIPASHRTFSLAAFGVRPSPVKDPSTPLDRPRRAFGLPRGVHSPDRSYPPSDRGAVSRLGRWGEARLRAEQQKRGLGAALLGTRRRGANASQAR